MILLYFLLIFQDQDNDWLTIEPPRVGARIEMPSAPHFSERKYRPVEDREEITVRTRSVILPSGKENLTFAYHDEQTTPSSKSKIKATLDGAVTGAIAAVNGNIIRQNEIFLKNHKGRDFVYQCELDDEKLQITHRLKIRSRVLLVRNRLFAMNYVSELDKYNDNMADRFFESFELVSQSSDAPPSPRPGRARELAAEK